MDNLKSAIADKVLEISSLDGNDMKSKLEKINRFRDFANACQTLILKYPIIETELLRMVENNDFDTKIASYRVDTIIRLSETGTAENHTPQSIEKDISELGEIEDQFPIPEEIVSPTIEVEETNIEMEVDTDTNDVPQTKSILDNLSDNNELSRKHIPVLENNETPPVYLPEDIDYEEVESQRIGQGSEDDEYIDFEDIALESESTKPLLLNEPAEEITEKVIEPTTETSYRAPLINSAPSVKPQQSIVKDNAKKGLQVVAVIAIILVLIFVIVFTIKNLNTVLWATAIIAVVGGIIWYLIKKKNNNDNDAE